MRIEEIIEHAEAHMLETNISRKRSLLRLISWANYCHWYV